MKKELELSRWEAQNRLILFLKLRKGKIINDQTIKDFGSLLRKMERNFKHSQTQENWDKTIEDFEAKEKALISLKTGFINFENGGYYRLNDIENFAHYTDKTYKAKIKEALITITKNDANVLTYALSGVYLG